jgi:CDGSH-type Zn-finger protein
MAKITCNNHGPLRIEGDFLLADVEGATFDVAGRTVISLCRCGASENKPFCDGAHKKVGFQSEIKARALPPQVPKPTPTPQV